MMTTNLLSANQRRERIAEKSSLVVEWIGDHNVSTTPILAEMLGLQTAATTRTLKKLEADGVLVADEIPALGGNIAVWGLSAKGALVYSQGHAQRYTPYQLRRSKAGSLAHEFEVQRARIGALRRGWRDWQSERELIRGGIASGWPKLPDALVQAADGAWVAIEVERTPKTLKRYRYIVGSYLLLLAKRKIQRVQYVTVDPVKALALQQIGRASCRERV